VYGGLHLLLIDVLSWHPPFPDWLPPWTAFLFQVFLADPYFLEVGICLAFVGFMSFLFPLDWRPSFLT
jgi:hypothetical protein